MKKLTKVIITLITVFMLLIGNLSVVLAATTNNPGPLQPGVKLSQQKMQKLSKKNIIYEEDIPVIISPNSSQPQARDIVPANCHLSVHYDSTNGLAFSTAITADALISSIKGVYSWNDFGSGSYNSYPFYTSSFIPYGTITNYEVIGNHYTSGTQIRCNTSGTIYCIIGFGKFNTTALVTIP